MGAGIQSALAVAIAKAYTEIVQEAVILIIEKQERFLHPHGFRHFYKLLKNLSNESFQVIYTTHERSFIDIRDYKNIHFVKKENNKTIVYSGNSIESSNSDEVKLVKNLISTLMRSFCKFCNFS